MDTEVQFSGGEHTVKTVWLRIITVWLRVVAVWFHVITVWLNNQKVAPTTWNPGATFAAAYRRSLSFRYAFKSACTQIFLQGLIDLHLPILDIK